MLGKLNRYLIKVSILLITAALIAGMVGCDDYTPPSKNLEIRTWYDLDDVRDNPAGNHTLMNDLDSTTAGYTELASPTANSSWRGNGWLPIGNREKFTGTFDGQGHEIRDLFINWPEEGPLGLFGVVGKGGHVTNISVVNANVTGYGWVGGLVGDNEGTISNSYSSGSVTGISQSVGGLVGDNRGGTVSNSYSTGSVTGDYWVGGLVGQNEYGTVSNSYSTGSVTGGGKVGGLVGTNHGGTMSDSYSTGNVTGYAYVGGLVGENEGTVSNSFWDIQTSGQATSDGGTGKNTTEMQDISTFSGAGWNIIAVALNETNPAYIWNIVNNVTYPFLSWQAV
jgi:hypothetical protein